MFQFFNFKMRDARVSLCMRECSEIFQRDFPSLKPQDSKQDAGTVMISVASCSSYYRPQMMLAFSSDFAFFSFSRRKSPYRTRGTFNFLTVSISEKGSITIVFVIRIVFEKCFELKMKQCCPNV